MTRRARVALAGVGLWYALGISHDLLVRQDAIDVPYATVRCSGAAVNAVSGSCVGDVSGPLSACERAVWTACDWAFPGGYLSQFLPRRRRAQMALADVELAATVACAHAVEEAGRP